MSDQDKHPKYLPLILVAGIALKAVHFIFTAKDRNAAIGLAALSCIPFGLSYIAIMTGELPGKYGNSINRDSSPGAFWIAQLVLICVGLSFISAKN